MKTISIEKGVRDVTGLLQTLRKHEPPFQALNVGTAAGRTYVYLDDGEAKDPSPIVNEWVDPAELRVEAGGPDSDGVPVAWADGEDVHRITIRKVRSDDPSITVPGNELVYVLTSEMVHVSDHRPSLAGGRAEITIGPSTGPAELDVVVIDPTNKLGKGTLRIRFGPKPQKPVHEGFLGRMGKVFGSLFGRTEAKAAPAPVPADPLLPPPPPPPAPPDDDE